MPINQRGQALLEVTIATGLAVMIITAIAITTIIGLRNSQFAQNQIQATKYAQEGLELVRAIQGRNCPVTVTASGTSYYWYDDPTIDNEERIWGKQANLIGTFQPRLSSTNCDLRTVTSPETVNNRFRRSILLGNITPTANVAKLKVTSVVSWTDFSGDHQSQLVTILSDD